MDFPSNSGNVSGTQAARSPDPTPGDWMAFAQAVGWTIAAMSANRRVKFLMSDGEPVHVDNRMRLDVMAAIAKGGR